MPTRQRRNLGPEIRGLLSSHIPQHQIAKTLNCSRAIVNYYARSMGLPKRKHTYDWEAIRNYYEDNHGMVETLKYFGINGDTWRHALRSGRITKHKQIHPMRRNIHELLVAGCDRRLDAWTKKRLVIEGILEYKCKICSIGDWMDKKITLHVDHINGNITDNRLLNLRFLCPNCHSQTETWGARNKRSRKLAVPIYVT